MVVNAEDYDLDRENTWCPGCGNFPILEVLKNTLAKLGLSPHQVLVVSGIGQAGKLAQHFRTNTMHVLHGRTLPVATGASLATDRLKIITVGGDGDGYAEGGNHLIHAARRNIDVTCMIHNNMIYGLTKGQASPTSGQGAQTPTTPNGNPLAGLNPILFLLGLRASFVARSFAGDKEQLGKILEKAINKPGFAFVDILQPCPSFNKVNTFKWFRDRVYDINEEGHSPVNLVKAFELAQEWGDRIPTGIFFDDQEQRPGFREALMGENYQPLAEAELNPLDIKEIMEAYG
ncbi:MAG: 2-oxoacid:ferredoxin oxidoreductase subunit beta [Bacillota bacterium]